MLSHRYVCRVLAVIGCFALGLAFPPTPAEATVVQTTSVTINGGEVDFGTGTHSLGSPSRSGTVAFDYTDVNGVLVASARIQGTVYWDALASGCGRIFIEYRNLSGTVIATDRASTSCPSPGFNANSSANQDPVDEDFASSSLHSVKIYTQKLVGSTFQTVGTPRIVTAPRTRNFTVKVNNNESDFGGGTAHLAGTPVGSGTVSFTRTNGSMTARMIGTLFWDSLNPFQDGTARVRAEFQNSSGSNLFPEQDFDLDGTGCCATDSFNQLPVATSAVSSGSLWKVRVRVGQVTGGSFGGFVTRLIDFNGAGTFELALSDATIAPLQRLSADFSWSVPDTRPNPINWHDLDSLEFTLRDGDEIVFSLLWNETDNTFRSLDLATGTYGPPVTPGTPGRLQTPFVLMDVGRSTVVGSGPEGLSVALNLSFGFRPAAAGRTFVVEVAGGDDFGTQEEFVKAGAITVSE